MKAKGTGKTRGRKPIPGDLQRVIFMVTKDQLELLEQEAKELSLSSSATLRQILNSHFASRNRKSSLTD